MQRLYKGRGETREREEYTMRIHRRSKNEGGRRKEKKETL